MPEPCAGPPGAMGSNKCPQRSGVKTKLCNGDMWLCKQCQSIRFPPDYRPGAPGSALVETSTGHTEPAARGRDTATSDVVASEASETERPCVTSELLCFVQNKIANTSHDMVNKAVCDFYSDAEIESAKRLLFEECDKIKVSGTRYKKRQGLSKCSNSIQDMIARLNEAVCDVPTFVARDLANIPPSSLDFYDLAKITRELNNLKSSAGDFATAVTMMKMLHQDVQSISSKLSAFENNKQSTDPSDNHIDATPDDSRENGPSVLGSTVSVNTHSLDLPCPEASPDAAAVESRSEDGDDEGSTDSEIDIPRRSPTVPAVHPRPPLTTRNLSSSSATVATQAVSQLVTDHADSDDGDFERVRTKPKKTAKFTDVLKSNLSKTTVFTNSKLHDKHKMKDRQSQSLSFKFKASASHVTKNRSVPVFISRLHVDTNIRDVCEHIKRITRSGLVKIETLKPKFDGYVSLKATVPTSGLKAILDLQNWPVGVLVKKFHGKN